MSVTPLLAHRSTSEDLILREALVPLQDRYDFILVDCPPSLGLLTLNTLTAADSVLIPIQCEFYALEGLSQLLNTVRLVQKGLNPSLDVEGVLLTHGNFLVSIGMFANLFDIRHLRAVSILFVITGHWLVATLWS